MTNDVMANTNRDRSCCTSSTAQPDDNETVCEQIFLAVLKQAKFQKFIVDSVVGDILINHDEGRQHSNCFLGNRSLKSRKVEKNSKLIAHNVDILIRLINSTIEMFHANEAYIVFDDFDGPGGVNNVYVGGNKNRDSANLFAAKVQIDRFSSQKNFDLVQFEQITRRISTLIKTFASRISPFSSLKNCVFYASFLCDLLQCFEENCSIHANDDYASDFLRLRIAIDDFYVTIVCQLNKRLYTRRTVKKTDPNAQRKHKKATCKVVSFKGDIAKTPVPVKINRSFLLSSNIQKCRSSLAASKVQQRPLRRSASMTPLKRRPSTISHFGRDTLKYSGRHLSKSLSDIDHFPKAARIAKELTADVVDELANRVNRVVISCRS